MLRDEAVRDRAEEPRSGNRQEAPEGGNGNDDGDQCQGVGLEYTKRRDVPILTQEAGGHEGPGRTKGFHHSSSNKSELKLEREREMRSCSTQ